MTRQRELEIVERIPLCDDSIDVGRGGLEARTSLFELDLGDETVTRSMKSPNQRLRLAIIADGRSRCLDATVQRRVRDDPAVPKGLVKLCARDDAIAILDQVAQQSMDLRLDRYRQAAAPQLE